MSKKEKTIPDISHYHPVNSWSKVKTSCSFLLSKATQGTNYVDPTLDDFIAGCEKNKIPYWLYTYLNKGNEKAQAEYMIKICKSKVNKYFIGYILDIEANNTVSNVKSALDYLNILGIKTMIYTQYSQYNTYKSVITARPTTCAWWEARYGKDNGLYSNNYPCHSGVDLHQFTQYGVCDGISGKCDLNRISGSSKTLDWFISPLKNTTASSSSTSTATSNSNQTSSIYYRKYTGISTKIDIVLKAIGVSSTCYGSVEKRTAIASKNGIINYTGTTSQNLKIISLAKSGKLKKVNQKNVDSYYKKYTGKSSKIDEVFTAIGISTKYIGSKKNRKPIAIKNGINNYIGTAAQNLKLIKLAKSGKLKKV